MDRYVAKFGKREVYFNKPAQYKSLKKFVRGTEKVGELRTIQTNKLYKPQTKQKSQGFGLFGSSAKKKQWFI